MENKVSKEAKEAVDAKTEKKELEPKDKEEKLALSTFLFTLLHLFHFCNLVLKFLSNCFNIIAF